MRAPIKSHRELDVYKTALAAALAISRIARGFPKDERDFKDQARRCGRSPGASIAEAWRKRDYPDYWHNKLSDAQAEAGEAQWWLAVALAEGYCTQQQHDEADDLFEKLIAQLAKMKGNPRPWITKHPKYNRPT